jgi:hypothetical protein
MGKEERMQRAKRCQRLEFGREESKEKCRQAALRNPAAIQKMLEAANSRRQTWYFEFSSQ